MSKKKGDTSRRETRREILFITLAILLMVLIELAVVHQNLYICLAALLIPLVMYFLIQSDKNDNGPISL